MLQEEHIIIVTFFFIFHGVSEGGGGFRLLSVAEPQYFGTLADLPAVLQKHYARKTLQGTCTAYLLRPSRSNIFAVSIYFVWTKYLNAQTVQSLRLDNRTGNPLLVSLRLSQKVKLATCQALEQDIIKSPTTKPNMCK
jgi:hypothetical protein